MSALVCDIIVIIPVFKQPGFLIEAIESVLHQNCGAEIRAVVVDDGCPFPETRAIARSYAVATGGKVAYIRRKNGGLSAARNAGIEFALQAFPDFKYLYLLDADNRMSSRMLGRMYQQIQQEDPEIGWLYPDIDMFGYNQSYSVSGKYSVLCHILENYCEAGSFISRKIIDAGVRFDEDMKHGFEDWDFWLQAAEHGFRGAHIREAGFQYRRRAESMLVGSERMRETIIGYMRLKHAKLLKPKSLLRLEEIEAPRYVEFQAERPDAMMFVDPRRRDIAPRDLDQTSLEFVRSRRFPAAAYFPETQIFSAPGVFEVLARAGVDRSVLRLAEVLLRDRHFVIVTLRYVPDDRAGIDSSHERPTQQQVLSSPLILVQSKIVGEAAADPDPSWISSILSENPYPLLASITCTLPEPCGNIQIEAAYGSVGQLFLKTVAHFRERIRNFSPVSPDWRTDARRSRARVSDVYSFRYPSGVVLPHIVQGGRRQVAFVLPLVEFGGVEKVVFNYAQVFRRAGHDVHLFVTNENQIGLAERAREIFSSINFLNLPHVGEGDWNQLYFGAAAAKYALSGDARELVGLLSSMDIVVNTHSIAAHGVMATLRGQGIKTYVGLHLVEQSRYGHPMGNPNIALAYEHVYDGFIVISDQLVSWCTARGIPRDKVIVARNAPSYDSVPETVARAMARRQSRCEGEPLRVLYLGRLDAQKGIDRLQEIMAATQGSEFIWRIAGRSILADAEALISRFNTEIEPPAMTDEALDALYEWADVFILPSRFEGVPLTILEAQRLGCLSIATKVGAVNEIIENGIDGFLVEAKQSEAAIVSDFVSILRRLATSRALVAQCAAHAHDRMVESDWESNLASWLEHASPSLYGKEHA